MKTVWLRPNEKKDLYPLVLYGNRIIAPSAKEKTNQTMNKWLKIILCLIVTHLFIVVFIVRNANLLQLLLKPTFTFPLGAK